MKTPWTGLVMIGSLMLLPQYFHGRVLENLLLAMIFYAVFIHKPKKSIHSDVVIKD